MLFRGMYVHTKMKGDHSMEASCLLQDRKELVRALEKRLDLKARYMGAPTFIYEIGPYKVLKDGTLTADDDAVDEYIIQELAAKGFIKSQRRDIGSTVISVPIKEFDGRTLMNIVFRINSKDELISKACGKSDAFKVSSRFVKALDKARPATREEFMEILNRCGGNSINTGITFTDDKVVYSGFPYTEDPGVAIAYAKLVEFLEKEASNKHRIRPEQIGLPENEKYSFRNWLVSIGMTGDEHKAYRAILLRNLSGHTAFRTKKQADEAIQKWSAIRRERREQQCSEFHIL